MRKIYIASNYRSEPIAVVLAENKQQAEAFFLGLNQNFASTEEIDPQNSPNLSGLTVLFTSTEKQVHNKTVRVFKRGL